MSAAEKAPEWVTVSQAGEMLGVKPSTVRRWCEMGYFPGAIRSPGGHRRIPKVEVNGLLARWKQSTLTTTGR